VTGAALPVLFLFATFFGLINVILLYRKHKAHAGPIPGPFLDALHDMRAREIHQGLKDLEARPVITMRDLDPILKKASLLRNDGYDDIRGPLEATRVYYAALRDDPINADLATLRGSIQHLAPLGDDVLPTTREAFQAALNGVKGLEVSGQPLMHSTRYVLGSEVLAAMCAFVVHILFLGPRFESSPLDKEEQQRVDEAAAAAMAAVTGEVPSPSSSPAGREKQQQQQPEFDKKSGIVDKRRPAVGAVEGLRGGGGRGGEGVGKEEVGSGASGVTHQMMSCMMGGMVIALVTILV